LNALSDIKKFTVKLASIADEYNFKPIHIYTEQLFDKLDTFDIDGIQSLLNEYPSLQDNLKSAENN